MYIANNKAMAKERLAWRGGDVNWHSRSPSRVRQAPAGLRDWLVSKSSLTQRLIDRCSEDFKVRVLAQAIERPLASEAEILELPRCRYSFVRQVQLLCGDMPIVYARTVIPYEIALNRLRGLTRLGARPLGAVLFSTPGMRRGEIQLAKITPLQRLYSTAHQGIGGLSQPIWGRRSLFYLYNQPLLVSEIFLSGFPFGHCD
jgi:chorismate--pyruvate lyase